MNAFGAALVMLLSARETRRASRARNQCRARMREDTPERREQIERCAAWHIRRTRRSAPGAP